MTQNNRLTESLNTVYMIFLNREKEASGKFPRIK